ncbi:MAG: septum formation inhibitor Maf, partial [Flavobacterium sp.]|nr:septum formation inhibitor Maf [Flavobacterium sp.]
DEFHFYPVKGGNSIKVSCSSQEWCGHTYMELLNKERYEVSLNSYFEGEGFTNLKMDKSLLEDDIWTMIRLFPKDLPAGNRKVIPSFFYLRLLHKEVKAYNCTIELIANDANTVYSIKYPELNRNISITFENSFPYKIVSWEESYPDGFGSNAKTLTTKGTLLQTIKSDYWNKNSNDDKDLRSKLKLD